MGHKGQVFALFAILLPIILMSVALIIDTGLLYMDKRRVDLVVRDTIEYGVKNIDIVTEQELYDLLYKNLDDISNTKIVNNDGILRISVTLNKKSLFANLFGKEKYEIESAYKGMVEQGTIRIVRG